MRDLALGMIKREYGVFGGRCAGGMMLRCA